MNQETSEVGVVLSIIEVIDLSAENIARIVWMMSGAILVGEDGCIWSPALPARVTTIDPATARKARQLLDAWERWATEEGVDPLREWVGGTRPG
jgi:hypothetical protein